MPRVSIVIPAYNARDYLPAALESVRQQTHDDWEIIVVDDGSSDGTIEVARRTGIPFRLVEQQNRGPGAARNRALEECTGDYVAFLDSDDRWMPEKLADQLRVIGERPEVGAVYTDLFVVDCDESRPTRKSDVVDLPSGRIDLDLLCEPRLITTSTLLFRRELLDEVGGFDERSPIAEDWEWFIRLASRTDVSAIREPLVLYRLHEGNTHKKLDRNEPEARRMIARAFESLERAGRPVSQELRREVLWKHHRSYGVAYLFQWRSWKALPFLLRAARYRPAELRLYAYMLAALLPGSWLRRLQELRGRNTAP